MQLAQGIHRVDSLFNPWRLEKSGQKSLSFDGKNCYFTSAKAAGRSCRGSPLPGTFFRQPDLFLIQ
jgi:hypothetical protein